MKNIFGLFCSSGQCALSKASNTQSSWKWHIYIWNNSKSKITSKQLKLMKPTGQNMWHAHRQQLSICAINCSIHPMGKQTHHTAIDILVIWSSAEVLDAHLHILEKINRMLIGTQELKNPVIYFSVISFAKMKKLNQKNYLGKVLNVLKCVVLNLSLSCQSFINQSNLQLVKKIINEEKKKHFF